MFNVERNIFKVESKTEGVAQMVKNLPAMRETRVQSLGQEGPLEEGMATRSSILVWRIPWTEEPGGLRSIRSQTVIISRKTGIRHQFKPLLINLSIV